MEADFLRALESFIAALSCKGKGIDQWRHDVTEAAHALNSAKCVLAHDGWPMQWGEFRAFLDFFDNEVRCIYLDWGGRGTPIPSPTPAWILRKLRKLAEEFGDRKPKPSRRAVRSRKPRPLTPRQVEVVQVVGECKGNVAAAARRLGRDRKTVEESYRAGMTKLGKTVYHSRDKTLLLARDRRGQETVSEGDDRRR